MQYGNESTQFKNITKVLFFQVFLKYYLNSLLVNDGLNSPYIYFLKYFE
jgi:hypothetical protein